MNELLLAICKAHKLHTQTVGGNLATMQAHGPRQLKVLHCSHSYPMSGNSMIENCYGYLVDLQANGQDEVNEALYVATDIYCTRPEDPYIIKICRRSFLSVWLNFPLLNCGKS